VLYVLAWPVTALLALGVLVLWREAILDVLTWAGTRGGPSTQAIDALDRALILGMAAVGVGAFVWIEYYLRRGLAGGTFLRRLAKVLGAQVALALAALALQALV